MKITLEALDAWGWLFAQQRTIFARAWPRGVVVNEANLRRAIKLGLDPQLWAGLFFSPKVHHRFVGNTEKRWFAHLQSPHTTRRFRNYLRSIIPDILKAAREMDKARRKK